MRPMHLADLTEEWRWLPTEMTAEHLSFLENMSHFHNAPLTSSEVRWATSQSELSQSNVRDGSEAALDSGADNGQAL